jgi:hypothetical protein
VEPDSFSDRGVAGANQLADGAAVDERRQRQIREDVPGLRDRLCERGLYFGCGGKVVLVAQQHLRNARTRPNHCDR